VSAPPNTILEDQNREWALDRLAAKSALYDGADSLARWQFWFVAVVPAVASIIALIWPSASGAVAIYGVPALLAELGLRVFQRGRRDLSARIQEEFDCRVLQLEWRDRSGDRPRPEDVDRWARHHPSRVKLRDWYPTADGRLPLPLARIVCQRANAVWDSHMRGRYADRVALGLGVLLFIIVGVGLARDYPFTRWAETVVALLPLIAWGINERTAQRDAAHRRAESERSANAIWQRALRASPNDPSLERDSRELQNDLFDQRCDSPPIFRWAYARFRDADEVAMQQGAESLVDEYERAKGQSTGAIPQQDAVPGLPPAHTRDSAHDTIEDDKAVVK
jgi:hypothetical protein